VECGRSRPCGDGIMGELVLNEVKEDKFTMLKEKKWNTGLLVKSLPDKQINKRIISF